MADDTQLGHQGPLGTQEPSTQSPAVEDNDGPQLYSSIGSTLSASYAGPSKPSGQPSDQPEVHVNELLEAGQQDCTSYAQGSSTQSSGSQGNCSLKIDPTEPTPRTAALSASGIRRGEPLTAGASLQEDGTPGSEQQRSTNREPTLTGPGVVHEDADLQTCDRQEFGAVGNEQEHSDPPSDHNSSSRETVSQSSSDRGATNPPVHPPQDRFWLAKQEAACLLITFVLFYSWYGHFESTLTSSQRGTSIFDIISFPWWAELAGRLWRWCYSVYKVCGTKGLVVAAPICVLRRFLIAWLDKPEYSRCPSLCRARRHLQGHTTTVVINLTYLFLCWIALIGTTPSDTTITGIQEIEITPFRALLYFVHTFTFLRDMTLPNALALLVVTFTMVARWKFQVEDHPSAAVMPLILGVVNFYLSFIHVGHTPYAAYLFAVLVTSGYLISLLTDLTPFWGALRNMGSIWAPNEKEVSKKCAITIRRTYSAPPLKSHARLMKGALETISIVDDSDERFWRLTVIENVHDAQAQKTEYLVQPLLIDYAEGNVLGRLIVAPRGSQLRPTVWWPVIENPTPSVSRLNTTFEFDPTCSIEQGLGGLASPLAALPQPICAVTVSSAATMTTSAIMTTLGVTGGGLP